MALKEVQTAQLQCTFQQVRFGRDHQGEPEKLSSRSSGQVDATTRDA